MDENRPGRLFCAIPVDANRPGQFFCVIPIEKFAAELTDRFGKLPYQVEELFDGLRLRWEAKKLGFDVAIGPVQKGKQTAKYAGVKDVRSALNTFLAKD